MGIITRLYHRSEGLADNRYNVFFLDMGENIHIHYRDLRIELSADEFLEFAELFSVYMPLVKGEIDRGYRDGIHPNTNQANTLTTFSNKKPLKHPIRYNPNRISIEENVDGYHIHLRNYKILLDKPSFANFIRAAREVVDKRETPIDLDETLELIEVNDLPHHVSERGSENGKEQAVVTVERPFFRKTQQLLEGLKYAKVDQSAEAAAYEKGQERIYLKIGPLPRLPLAGRVGSTLVPLDEYIKKNAKRFTPEEINLLKLQYLDISKHVSRNKLEKLVDLDYQNLIYDTDCNRIIFPSKVSDEASDVKKEYDRFMIFLKDHGLSFVKPGKIPYTDAESGRLQSVFHEYVRNTLGKMPCVSKVYLFNAESKKRSGRYQVPFVHFDWAKLGSDFDLLIEIDERYPIPKEWAYKFYWKACGSDYYLLGDVDYQIASPYVEQFSNVDFFHHLVEAYLYFGSKGNQAVKNEYLKKHNAKLLYKKPDGRPMVETAELLRAFLTQHYGLAPVEIEKLDVPSFNEVFRIGTQEKVFAAKLMKKEDFTPAMSGHSGWHLEYEAQLLEALSGREELPVVSPLSGKDGRVLQQFESRFCMLFPFLASDKEDMASADKLHAAAKTLALLHRALAAVNVAKDWYRFNEALEYWIDQFVTLYEKFSENDKDAEEFRSLVPRMKEAGQRILDSKNLPWGHSHGDICPRNFFYIDGEAVIFDFQVAHFGPRIEDVAEGALEFAFNGSELDRKLIDEFIAGYCVTNPLSADELDLLPTMLFLQSAFKLARAFRVQVLFGYRVDRRRVAAFSSYAYAPCERC